MKGSYHTKKTAWIIALTVLGLFLLWGGMMYCFSIPNSFKLSGVIAALIGCFVLLAAVLIFESNKK